MWCRPCWRKCRFAEHYLLAIDFGGRGEEAGATLWDAWHSEERCGGEFVKKVNVPADLIDKAAHCESGTDYWSLSKPVDAGWRLHRLPAGNA